MGCNSAQWSAEATVGGQLESGCSPTPVPGFATDAEADIDGTTVPALILVPAAMGDIYGDFFAVNVSDFEAPELVVTLGCPEGPCNYGYYVATWAPGAQDPSDEESGQFDGIGGPNTDAEEIRIDISIDIVDVTLSVFTLPMVTPPMEHALFADPRIVEMGE